MKQKVLWMLAALMLSVVAVSCSDDEDDEGYFEELNNGMVIKNGSVVCGDTKLPNEPVYLTTLPQWLKLEIIGWGCRWADFILLEGTWDGRHAYWYYNTNSLDPMPDYFYFDDKSQSSVFKTGEVDWRSWKCIYLWNWDIDMDKYTDLSEYNLSGVNPIAPNAQVDLNALPDAIKDKILEYYDPFYDYFTLLEGTWNGQHAYWYWFRAAPTYPKNFYFNDSTSSLYEYRKVDWLMWRCIYEWLWYDEEYGEDSHPDVPYDPVDIDALPENIRKYLTQWKGGFVILKGVWKSQEAYWLKYIRVPYLINFFIMEDGTKSYYKYEDVDWSTWKCVYDSRRLVTQE